MKTTVVKNDEKRFYGVTGVARTDRGRSRSENQDAYRLIERHSYHVYVVADGMGGHQGGAEASRVAVESFEHYLLKKSFLSEKILREAARFANKKIIEAARRDPSLSSMGTTLVAIGFSEKGCFVLNVGDSRAYLIRNGRTRQLTEDHSVVSELIRSGTLTPEQAHEAPISHMLTRSLGSNSEVEIDCRRLSDPPCAGDRYILCSDGLHGVVSDKELASIVRGNSLEDAASGLIERANELGGPDNITVIAIETDIDLVSKADVIPFIGPDSDDPHSRARTGSFSRFGEAQSMSRVRQVLPLSLLFTVGILAGVLLHSGIMYLRGSDSNLEMRGEVAFSDSSDLSQTVSVLSRLDALSDVRFALRGSQGESSSTAQEVPGIAHNLPALDKRLVEVRNELEITTRKLALWHARKEALNEQDPVQLASSVAVTSKTVRQKIEAYEAERERYLREAEALLYNPLDRKKERQVAQLMRTKNLLREELRKSVRKAIEQNITESLQTLMQLTHRRDAIQASLRNAPSVPDSP